MVIGHGMIAGAFSEYKDDPKIIIYASGVSNSKEVIKSNFLREKNLLIKTIYENPEKTIIYFSTCSIEDISLSRTGYVQHKKEIESTIQQLCEKFYIFRLPQVVGKTKSNTLVKFLFESVLAEKKIFINKNSTRNLIHVNDVVGIVSLIIQNDKYKNKITNIATINNLYVLDIVLYIEQITGVKAHYDLVECGSSQNIDISAMKSLFKTSSIFETEYTYNILSEYFNELKKDC